MKRTTAFLFILILLVLSSLPAGSRPVEKEGYWQLVRSYPEGDRERVTERWSTKILEAVDGRIRRETVCSGVEPHSRYVTSAEWSAVPKVLVPKETFSITIKVTNNVAQTGFGENYGYYVAFDPWGEATGSRVKFGQGGINSNQGAGASSGGTHTAEVPGRSYAADNKMHFYISTSDQVYQYVYEWKDGTPPATAKPESKPATSPEAGGADAPAVAPGTTRGGLAWQSRGEGKDGRISCNSAIKIGAPAVLLSLSAGEKFISYRLGDPVDTYRLGEGFWIQPKGGSAIVFTKTDPRLMSGNPFILQPGEYCAYPNLPPDKNMLTLTWEVRVLAAGEVPAGAPKAAGQKAGLIVSGGGGQTRGPGKDGIIKCQSFTLTRRAVIMSVQSLEAGISFILGSIEPTRIGEGFWIQPEGGQPIIFHKAAAGALDAGYVLPPGKYCAYPNLPTGKDSAALTIKVKTL